MSTRVTGTAWYRFSSVGGGGHSHLWRQQFPDGKPQQITFGPTDEETVATALESHICRCSGYVRYFEAVRDLILTTPGLTQAV